MFSQNGLLAAWTSLHHLITRRHRRGVPESAVTLCRAPSPTRDRENLVRTTSGPSPPGQSAPRLCSELGTWSRVIDGLRSGFTILHNLYTQFVCTLDDRVRQMLDTRTPKLPESPIKWTTVEFQLTFYHFPLEDKLYDPSIL